MYKAAQVSIPTYSQVKSHIGMKLRVRAFWSCNIWLQESAILKDKRFFGTVFTQFWSDFVAYISTDNRNAQHNYYSQDGM